MSKVGKIVLAVDLRMKGLDVAVKILKNYATQTMYNTPKDEIALVLIGSVSPSYFFTHLNLIINKRQ